MPGNNNVIQRLLLEAAPDPTVVITLDFTSKVITAISDAVPKDAQDRRAIQHYLQLAVIGLDMNKSQHAKITP